ncbi:MAG: helix-turn-helix transcriptional regulator [Bacteroidales bacterium]|nr:helix-turn-helix transcriptional regulator [Bacteroidales bacterium]
MYICSMQTELLKGTLSTIILKLLAENGRMYGYQITQKIKEISEGKILVKEGSLYPALFKLKEEGWVETEEENIGKRVRRYYSLTSLGVLEAQRRLNEIFLFIELLHKLFDKS